MSTNTAFEREFAREVIKPIMRAVVAAGGFEAFVDALGTPYGADIFAHGEVDLTFYIRDEQVIIYKRPGDEPRMVHTVLDRTGLADGESSRVVSRETYCGYSNCLAAAIAIATASRPETAPCA